MINFTSKIGESIAQLNSTLSLKRDYCNSVLSRVKFTLSRPSICESVANFYIVVSNSQLTQSKVLPSIICDSNK